MKVAIPGRAIKMPENLGPGAPAQLSPLARTGKIPYNNIEMRPAIDYLSLGSGGHGPLQAPDDANAKEWRRTTKLYKKDLKAKGNIRPSTAVRRHVKKISEEFTMTQTKYENSVNTTSSSASKASEGKEKAGSKAASASISNKIPQSKFPKNVLSKISCTKCDTITGRKAPMAPLVSAAVVSSSKAPSKPAPILKAQGHKAHRASASSTSPKRIRDASSSPQKKASLSPPGSSPRPRLKHSYGRGSGGVGGLEVGLAPTNASVPKSPGKKREGAGVSPRSQQVSFEQIKKAKLFTEKAIMEGRVFSIFGYFPAIKDALKRRGWVEKIQHSVPYVNPHPNNCVCPHVGYQSVFISPPPLTPPSTTAATTPAATATSSTTASSSATTSTAASSNASTASGAATSEGDQEGPASASESATSSPDAPCTGEGAAEAEAQLNGDTTEGPSLAESGTPSDASPQPPPPSLTSSFSSSSCRSSSPSSPTSSSSVLELVERPQTKTTANLGSSSVESVAPAAKDAAKAPSPGESSPQSLAAGESESRNASPNQSQASDESSSVPGESRRGSKPLDFFPDNEINTAILGPSEIRKGLKECITEKNSALFKYSTTSILKKLKSKSEEANKAKTPDAGDTDQQDKEEDNEEKKEEDKADDDDPPEDKEEPKDAEPAPEPYNPYVEYQLSNTDLPLVARLLRNVEPNLLWTWTRDSISFKHLSREQLVNRFPNTPFTTKYGLCGTLQQLHWFSEAAGVDTFVPRGYCIGHEDERTAFVHDYRTTACLNVLKWVTERHGTLGAHAVADAHGEVNSKRVRQALAHVEQYIQSCCHDDLDSPPPTTLRDHEWDGLLAAHYRIVHMDKKIKISSASQLQTLVKECESALRRVEPFWPQLAMDGLRNLWIVKPGAQSRGRGIFMMNHLEEILSLVQSPLIYETKYVVQKYIERPLLIHNTKFDIRQWFMVTDWNPLHVWVYKECYLRFCSQQYDLTNNNEAIHLSNNAIQCKYLNGERSGELPDENMWDCYQFKEYLRSLKKEKFWDEVIYPGMRDALVAAMLAAQVEMDTFKHGFELFGADFMLTEDLRPWLIEINSSPCMASTTSVTKRMCAQCLQDVIKVVVDYKHNKTADTGQFELAYRDSERSVPNPPYLGVNLQVVGRQIKKGPVKIEKRKPKKARPAERLVKPLPLITLSLEEGAHYGPREHALPHHHPHPRETPGAFARRCYLLDCRRYAAGGAGGSATPGGPGSAPVLAPIGSEEESGERGTSADSSVSVIVNCETPPPAPLPPPLLPPDEDGRRAAREKGEDSAAEDASAEGSSSSWSSISRSESEATSASRPSSCDS